jgi:competence ComEA-like helix-hairpin-helix protein
MSDTLSALYANQTQTKDDRLIVLFGIGLIFVCIYSFQYVHKTFGTARKQVQLQWNGTELVVGEQASFSPEEGADPQHYAHISAHLTPFFFAPMPINEADQQLLETLSGIGPHLASEIIKTRSQQGIFRNPEDLLRVRGIGKKRMLKYAGQFSYR